MPGGLHPGGNDGQHGGAVFSGKADQVISEEGCIIRAKTITRYGRSDRHSPEYAFSECGLFSFKYAIDQHVKQAENLVPDVLVTPALFSAALNYYLAARTAALCPNGLEQYETVRENWQAAGQALRLVGQYDEATLATKILLLYQLWTRELLPPNKADLVLTEG